MAYGLSNGHVTDDVTWPWKVKLVTAIFLERNISKTTWARDFKFGTRLCMGNNERAHKKISPRVGVAYGTWPYNYWHMIEHTSKTIWATDFKFGKQLWLPGSAYYGLLWCSTVGYPSDSLAFCCTIHLCDVRIDGRAIAYSALSMHVYAICCRALKWETVKLFGW